MRKLFLDTETYSRYDVTEYGTEVHARDAEVILASYALDDGPVHLIETGQSPEHFIELMYDADKLIAHNAWFDRLVLYFCGWCDRPPEDWHCTMAQAYAHAMPGGLEQLGRFLGLPADQLKKPDGKKLIQLFSKPQRGGARLTKADRPEEWARFRDYGYQDTETLREVFKRLPRINMTL